MKPEHSDYLRTFNSLKSERSSWDKLYTDLSEYIMPARTRFFMSQTNRGDTRVNRQVNNTPQMAWRILKAGMHAGITSPARPWFRLTTPDPGLAEYGPVSKWLHVVTQRMATVFAKSNLYNALPVIYGDVGGFGTAAAVIYEDEDDVIRVYTYPIGEYSLAANDRGVVDTFVREFKKTVRQLVDEFGLEKCSLSVQNLHRTGELHKWIDVIHVIKPNKNYKRESNIPTEMKFESVYFEKGAEQNEFLRRGGFMESPLLCPRWDVIGNDVYGHGCGVVALGDSKALQLYEKRKAQALDKMVNPPLQAPSSIMNSGVSTLPGGINYHDDTERGGIRPLYEVNFRPDIAQQEIANIERRVNSAFFADLFLMLSMQSQDMTATEVVQRQEEKMLMLGPVLERLNDELLDPLIDRTFNIMMRKGLLPPPPEELVGVDLKVEHISIMAQAQKMVQTATIDRAVGFIGQIAQARPDVLDKINVDATVDTYADMLGIPPDIIYSTEEANAIRQQRAQAQAQQMQQEQQAQAAATAKDLSQANTEGDNALSDIIEGMTGQ